MWDILGLGVLRADGANTDVIGFTCLGHGIVARVEILALLRGRSAASDYSNAWLLALSLFWSRSLVLGTFP
jgi:hypothetical protein